MASRTPSDGSIGESLGGSLNGSVGDQGSTSTAGSRKPRRSLDELLALQRAKETDFAGMPTLSSFRAEEMSAVTSTSYTSFASNSRGGDSKGGDCDISLPSLSSFRLEDLSTCSSYHSVQTNANHLSDQSAEGWASFTSGNVSAETNSQDGKKTPRPDVTGEINGAPLKPSRSSSGSSLNGSPTQKGPSERGVLKRESSMTSNAAVPKRTPEPEAESTALPMKRPTRTVSPTQDDRRSKNDHIDVPGDSTTGCARPQTIDSLERNSPERKTVERSESLQLSLLQQHPQKDRTISTSTDSLRNSVTEGSSGSLRGGDSLPRLPRRTSTVDDQGFLAEDDTGRFSDDASNLSDDESTKISDDDVTRISDDDVSLNSDIESDISIETDAEQTSVLGDMSERSAAETSKDMVSPENAPSEAETGAESRGISAASENEEKKNGNGSQDTRQGDARSESLGKAVTTADIGLAFGDYESLEGVEATGQPDNRSVNVEEVDTGKADDSSGKIEESETSSDDGGGEKAGELETAEAPAEATVGYEELSPRQQIERAESANTEDVIDTTAEGPVEDNSQSKPPNNPSVDENGPKKNDSDGSGGTSAEESGTTTDTDANGGRKDKNDGENKRGKLLRKVSSTFRNLGKSASFRNSFRMIGKQASKLKMRGGRKEKEDAIIRHEPLVDDPGSPDE